MGLEPLPDDVLRLPICKYLAQATLYTWKPEIFKRDAQRIIDAAKPPILATTQVMIMTDEPKAHTIELPEDKLPTEVFDFGRAVAREKYPNATGFIGQIVLSKPMTVRRIR